jgi:hypothetical protein
VTCAIIFKIKENSMVDIEEIQKYIITALKPLGLDKVILFRR